MSFETRRIFKSAVTSQNLIRELLQMMFLGELLACLAGQPMDQQHRPVRQPRGRFRHNQSRMGQSRDPADRGDDRLDGARDDAGHSNQLGQPQ